MSEVTPTNNSVNEVIITNESLSSDSLTWDTIAGTWNEHDYDTWNSPRMGMTKDSANEVTITNDSL